MRLKERSSDGRWPYSLYGLRGRAGEGAMCNAKGRWMRGCPHAPCQSPLPLAGEGWEGAVPSRSSGMHPAAGRGWPSSSPAMTRTLAGVVAAFGRGAPLPWPAGAQAPPFRIGPVILSSLLTWRFARSRRPLRLVRRDVGASRAAVSRSRSPAAGCAHRCAPPARRGRARRARSRAASHAGAGSSRAGPAPGRALSARR